MASPLPAEALLGPFRATPVAPLTPATSVHAGLGGDAADAPEKIYTLASSVQSGHEDAAASAPEITSTPAPGALRRFLDSIVALCSAPAARPSAETCQDQRRQRRQPLLAS